MKSIQKNILRMLLFFNLQNAFLQANLLHDAAYSGNINNVIKLIEHHVYDINEKDEYGRTALYFVESIEIVKLLIQAGIDVNSRTNWGVTALYFAQTKEIAELLIKSGADIYNKSDDGEMPIHYAESKEIAQLYIQAGIDVNISDNNGWTVLHESIESEGENIGSFIQYLLDQGADIHAKACMHGETHTPLSLFIECYSDGNFASIQEQEEFFYNKVRELIAEESKQQ